MNKAKVNQDTRNAKMNWKVYISAHADCASVVRRYQ